MHFVAFLTPLLVMGAALPQHGSELTSNATDNNLTKRKWGCNKGMITCGDKCIEEGCACCAPKGYRLPTLNLPMHFCSLGATCKDDFITCCYKRVGGFGEKDEVCDKDPRAFAQAKLNYTGHLASEHRAKYAQAYREGHAVPEFKEPDMSRQWCYARDDADE